MSDLSKVRMALEFYADPVAWKKLHDPDNDIGVPDFYSELSFGDTAAEALSSLPAIEAGTAAALDPATVEACMFESDLKLLFTAACLSPTVDTLGDLRKFTADVVELYNKHRSLTSTQASAVADDVVQAAREKFAEVLEPIVDVRAPYVKNLLDALVDAAISARLIEPATPAPSPAGVPDGWQPIETAPRDGKEILACWDAPTPEYRAIGVVMWSGPANDGCWISCPGHWRKEPTHWRPLPAPPSEVKP